MIINNRDFTEETFLEEIIKSKEQGKPTDALRDFFYDIVISESHRRLSCIDVLDRAIIEAKAFNDVCKEYSRFNPERKGNPVIYMRMIIRSSIIGNFT